MQIKCENNGKLKRLLKMILKTNYALLGTLSLIYPVISCVAAGGITT